MHQRMPVALFALAAILASSFGCARKADDAKISSEIQSKYGQDSGLSTKQLSVQASNGVVTISGFVDNDTQRAAAARQAAAVDGVKEVVNNLQVASASNDSAPALPVRKVAATKLAAAKSPSVRKSSQSRTAEDVAAGNDSTAESNNAIAADSPESAPPEDQPSSAASSAASSSGTPPEPPQPLKVTIEQGTPISVRLIDSIDSEKNQAGDTFHATLNTPLSAEGSEAIPAGTNISGHLVDVKSAIAFLRTEKATTFRLISSGKKAVRAARIRRKKSAAAPFWEVSSAPSRAAGRELPSALRRAPESVRARRLRPRPTRSSCHRRLC